MSAPLSAEAATAQLADLRRRSPNLLFIIARSKNLNIVVYEAKLSGPGRLDSSEPVIVYWLDIDPAYAAENRRKGVMTDRSELGVLERNFAYGLSSSAIAAQPGHYAVQLVAFSERVVTVHYDSAKQRAVALMAVNGAQCELERIFVSATDSSWGRPTVHHVDVTAIDSRGQRTTERIVKN